MRRWLAALALLWALPCQADDPPGLDMLELSGSGGRPLKLQLWHPAGPGGTAVSAGGNAVFRGEAARSGAPPLPGPLPLVLISHGGLRSASGTGSWLAADLARKGYLAVLASAPPPDPAGAPDEIWRRPADLSLALGTLLADPLWGGRIDPDRISVLGFALGGTAALMLAGAELDAGGYARSCEAGGSGPDCAWMAAAGVSPADADPAGLAADRRDARVAAAIAVLPEYPGLLSALPADAAGDAITEGHAPADAFPVCTEAGPEILGADAGLCGGSPEARRAAHARLLAEILAALGPPGGR
ncbi:hypothetical protein [Mangrovicoccus sp. HB161399]|uniref:alpha/beta hydrolase family protein n=1 Tax=Mangrovicoccus sp. HB161399 TaxID=2720392 RepID=UPI00155542D6|nr:hypothetical protein [Mangrovicoccus sp. HB161399]